MARHYVSIEADTTDGDSEWAILVDDTSIASVDGKTEAYRMALGAAWGIQALGHDVGAIITPTGWWER
jgi:glucose dehydrogenase